MFNALLVDDEPTVLETLRNTILWNQFGFDEVFTATDGNKALEIMEIHKIDLLITDIRMPHMNGMDLLKQVRSIYPNTHCILLSAYSEFEYAREAITLGVENYLLKPIQTEEIENTIEKAIDNIYTNQNNYKVLFRNNILLRWATGNISSDELSERASMLNINIYLSNYCVICIKKKQPSVSLSAYQAQCIKALIAEYEIHKLRDNRGRLIFIVGGQNIQPEKIADNLQAIALNMGIGASIALSIGMVVNNSDSLPLSYQTACNLIEAADMTAPEMIVLTKQNISNHEDDVLAKEIHSILLEQDETKRAEEYKILAHNMLALMDTRDKDSVISTLYHSILRVFLLEFPNVEGIQEQIKSRMQLFTMNLTIENFIEAISELLDYTFLLFRYHFEQLSPVIQAAINYIHNNYADSISIKEFCNKNKMSTAYLGYLFKKETGMFFNNYLTQFRICCAISLLKNTDNQINEISKQVGFSSTSYFISCFKKQTGLSPIKYRETYFI